MKRETRIIRGPAPIDNYVNQWGDYTHMELRAVRRTPSSRGKVSYFLMGKNTGEKITKRQFYNLCYAHWLTFTHDS